MESNVVLTFLASLYNLLVYVYTQNDEKTSTRGQRQQGLRQISEHAKELHDMLIGNLADQEFVFELFRASLARREKFRSLASVPDLQRTCTVLLEALSRSAWQASLATESEDRQRMEKEARRHHELAVAVGELMWASGLEPTTTIADPEVSCTLDGKEARELGAFGQLLRWCIRRHEGEAPGVEALAHLTREAKEAIGEAPEI